MAPKKSTQAEELSSLRAALEPMMARITGYEKDEKAKVTEALRAEKESLARDVLGIVKVSYDDLSRSLYRFQPESDAAKGKEPKNTKRKAAEGDRSEGKEKRPMVQKKRALDEGKE
ncbi:hypothetical protein BSKO_13659 [Bryopsis sp. KO-2023]|nr:hypothetical protein BSKO_13659 [Bryopsis sp. KO-2023]